MQTKDSALVLVKPEVLEIREVPVRQPGPGEVLIAVHSVGICGSDVHYWRHGRIGSFIVDQPMILGHESSGTVIQVGSDVTHLKQGDRVAVEPGIPCYHCNNCLHGRYNLCPQMRFLATPPIDGDLRHFHTHDANFCFKLPDHVSFEEGALVEPLSVAVHACRRGNVTLGSNVLVCGSGPIGLVNVSVARSMGANKIVATDLMAYRLDVAKQLGATHTVALDANEAMESTVERIKACFDNNQMGADVVIECSGSAVGVTTAIKACRSGGVVVLVGMGPNALMTVPLLEVGLRELEVKGIFRYCNCYPAAISLLARGDIDLKPLITHRFTLEEGVKAFETAHDASSRSVKVMISCHQK